jgi:hypothetical protein
MATKNRSLKRGLLFNRAFDRLKARPLHFLSAAGLIFTFSLICRPAAMATLATISIRPQSWFEEGVASDTSLLRGKVQKHFLTFGIYIPLSDIVVIGTEASNDARLLFIMRKSCGDGMIYAWVPFQFRIPFFGIRTYEWCWTFPKLPVANETPNLPPQKGLL